LDYCFRKKPVFFSVTFFTSNFQDEDLNGTTTNATNLEDDDFIARFVREVERSINEASQMLGIEMPKWN
jgi:hypothetical protein